jgi:hypothetical protein
MNKQTPFSKLTRAQKRVRIAQDVLAQLESGEISATHGIYLENKNRNKMVAKNADGDTELCDILNSTQCRVCGIGALFVGAVKLADRLKIRDLNRKSSSDYGRGYDVRQLWSDDIRSYLHRFFSKDQVAAIEAAFERGVVEHVAARVFAPKVKGAKNRMRLIMENIIVNGGTFKWNVQPVPTTVWVTQGYKR